MTVSVLPAVVFDGVIDVSHHNGAIDWPAVAGAGIALAFIKATQGTAFIDPAFERNRNAAVTAGILVVPYHFIDTADPDRQAGHFLSVTGLEEGQPAMLDWESAAPASTLVAIGSAVTLRTKRYPVAYYGFAQLAQPVPELSLWPLMLPAYPSPAAGGSYAGLVTHPPRLPPGRDPARPYDFHQYTDAGRIAGIATPVDRSIWVGTKVELQSFIGTPAAAGQAAIAGPDASPVTDAQQAIPPVVGIPAAIVALQAALQRDGFYHGALDGKFFRDSQAALDAYYRSIGVDRT